MTKETLKSSQGSAKAKKSSPIPRSWCLSPSRLAKPANTPRRIRTERARKARAWVKAAPPARRPAAKVRVVLKPVVRAEPRDNPVAGVPVDLVLAVQSAELRAELEKVTALEAAASNSPKNNASRCRRNKRNLRKSTTRPKPRKKRKKSSTTS